MPIMRMLICLLTMLALGACSDEALMQKFSSPETQAIAIAYLDQLRARDFAAFERDADPSIAGGDSRHQLEEMAQLIPPKMPTSVKLVGVHTNYGDDATTISSTFEYNFDGAWLIASISVKEKNGARTITGISVYPLEQSLEVQNRFTLSDKSALRYIMLSAAIAAVLLTLYALVLGIRTRFKGRKWPWIVFVLVGFGKISVNWTTGDWNIAPIGVQLFSAAATAEIYGPWIISFSLPVGAICFLLHRQKLRAQ
jgi:hypothetical protein